MALVSFEVDLAPGAERIVLNGVDVTKELKVQALSAVGRANTVPTLTLELIAGADPSVVKGLGEVVVTHVDDRAAIVDFLGHVDAARLDAEVLRRTEWGSGKVMATALAVLSEWARGSTA